MRTHSAGTATADPSTPTFASLGLDPYTLRTLADMQIDTPTPIQEAAIPPLLQGKDLIGQARTGSGKTLAFITPAVELIDPAQRQIQVLVLTPTRELAVQIGSVVDQFNHIPGLKSVLIYGGRSARTQINAIRRGAQIVIGTPGRVLDLIRQGELRLDRLRFLVLDEADELLDRGFGPDVEKIIGQTSPRRQTALFSATVPDWVQQVASKHLTDPVHVALDVKPEDRPAIDHVAFMVPDGDKVKALCELLDHRSAGSIIVFGRTKHGVRKLARRLEKDGYDIAALQGNLSQNARERVMSQFRSGDVQILAATNVAARGLDVSDVDLVINLELPESSDLLTHRIGRTGRMGRQGQAITLLSPTDQKKWRKLERDIQSQITQARWQGAEHALNTSPAEPSGPAMPDTRQRREQATLSTAQPASANPVGQQEQPPSRRGKHHPITCDNCGQPGTVPFKPDPTRPVFCRSCFQPSRRNRRAA